MEDPSVELARRKEIDVPVDPRQRIVHPLKRVRFRLSLFPRLAYYAYGLGDEVQLSAKIMPVNAKVRPPSLWLD